MTATRKWAVVDPAVGVRIREAREAAGISQRAACRPTMYTAAALSRIENGQRQPSLAFPRALAPQLKTSVAWLETGEDLIDVRLTVAQGARLLDQLEADGGDWELVQTLMAALHVERDYVQGLA